MEDYYPDELLILFEEYSDLHQLDNDDPVEEVSATDFLGEGGEWV